MTGGAGVAPRIAALDGLRGCAVLMVLFYHFMGPFTDTADFATKGGLWVFSFGWTGVDLFFVLSGFLITGILFDAKGSERYFRTFYMRRILRIVPLYYGALALIFFVPRFIASPTALRFTAPFSDQVWYWLYLQNFHRLRGGVGQITGHLWSLAIEEQFYLVWPLVILVLSRRRALQFCGALVVMALSIRVVWVLVLGELGWGIFWMTHTRLEGLAIGAAIALLARGTRGLDLPRRLAAGVAGVSLLVIGWIYAESEYFSIGNPILRSFGLTAVALLFGSLLVISIERPPRLLASFLESRILAFFGRYSYGMYVVHLPVMIMLGLIGFTGARFERAIGIPVIAFLSYIAAMVAISTTCAWLIWHLYEKHFMKLKSRFEFGKAGV